MANINLKRLMKKEDIQLLVAGLVGLNAAGVQVVDQDGTILVDGGVPTDSCRQPIRCEERILGWVIGGDKGTVLANFLNHFITGELEKKNLGRETLEKYKEINLFYSLTEKLAARRNYREVAELMVVEVRHLIKADGVLVISCHDNKPALALLATAGDEVALKACFVQNQRLFVGLVAAGKGEIINDIHEDPRFTELTQLTKSIMYAPLLVKDRAAGLVFICSSDHLFYTANDLKILSALAFVSSTALENASLYEGIRDAFHTTVYTLAETIEKRDRYTGGHTRRVMENSLSIGAVLGMDSESLERLKLAAILHDIGKIGIRDDILLAPRQLTPEEYGKLKLHTVYGQEILGHIKYLQDIVPAVRQHHERVDGNGYPDGAVAKDICLGARVIAVADAYDAMTSSRPYRARMGTEQATAEICRHSGTQFDPQVVEAFLAAAAADRLIREV